MFFTRIGISFQTDQIGVQIENEIYSDQSPPIQEIEEPDEGSLPPNDALHELDHMWEVVLQGVDIWEDVWVCLENSQILANKVH